MCNLSAPEGNYDRPTNHNQQTDMRVDMKVKLPMIQMYNFYVCILCAFFLCVCFIFNYILLYCHSPEMVRHFLDAIARYIPMTLSVSPSSSVGLLVGWFVRSVGLSVCHNFLKGAGSFISMLHRSTRSIYLMDSISIIDDYGSERCRRLLEQKW